MKFMNWLTADLHPSFTMRCETVSKSVKHLQHCTSDGLKTLIPTDETQKTCQLYVLLAKNVFATKAPSYKDLLQPPKPVHNA